MTIQDLIQQMQDIGFTNVSSFSDLAGVSQQDILSQMQSLYFPEGGEDSLLEGMFQPISSQMIGGALGKSYAPMMKSKGSTLLKDLALAGGGKKAKRAAGGFAGSSQQQQYQKGIKDVFGQGFTDTLTQRGQSIGQSIQGISDLISSWQEQATQLT